MALSSTSVCPRLRSLTLALVALPTVPALTTSVSAQEAVNTAAGEQSNTTFVSADEFFTRPGFVRLRAVPQRAEPIGLLLPNVQSGRE